tara:strand:+ start:5617 stop:7377 length:1761 start_codon:yes stop_codon:yes gene_type:complete
MSSYVKPEITESALDTEDWVEYGKDNAYFSYVNDRYYGSPTNNAIINGFTEMIYGGGLMVEDGSELDQDKLSDMFDEESVMNICADFKRQGNASFEILKLKGGGFKINHLPVESLRANKVDKNGKIKGFWFCSDWEKFTDSGDKELQPVFIPNFEVNTNAAKSVFYLKNYQPNTFYYSPPDYQGALPYAELEEEIANYHISNVKNAFAPSAVINYNNGVPDKETRDNIEQKTKDKFTGSSNAGRLLVAFNDSSDNAVTMESFQLSDAHNQYEFLSGEARKQLMVGHRITSPMLFGIKDNTGLGNNAEELDTASRLMDSTVIRPKQNAIIKAFTTVLTQYNIDVELFFENIQPLSVTSENQDETTSTDSSSNEITEDVNTSETVNDVAMSAEGVDLDKIAEGLIKKGEEEDDVFEDFELFDVDWAETDEDDNIEERLNGLVHFAAGDKSKQDGDIFKVRYMYKTTAKNKPQDPNNHRPLCSKLISASLLYRKEDIVALSSKGGAESKGASYSVFLHKGGANCQHGWERRIFRKRLKKDGSAWGGGAMNGVTRAKIYDAIRGDGNISQSADKKALIAPRDTATKGYKR